MKKIKVLRVVTNSSVVPWHLKNTLELHRLDENIKVFVVGENVEQYSNTYPHVIFINWKVERKPNFFKDLHSLYNLIKIIFRIKPDIVHSLMPKASLLASVASFITRVPVRIHTFTGQMWNLDLRYKKNILYWFDRLVFNLNTICLTDSPSQSEFLLEHGFVSNTKKLECLGFGSLSGVDSSSIKYNQETVDYLKNKYSLHNKFVCLFLARKNQEKGAFDLLEIFQDFNDGNSVLLFIGPDNSDGWLSNLRLSKPSLFNDVIELDSVTNPFDFIKCSDVLILLSKREGFGSIVIDAASMGVPSIGTNIVGLRDAIDNGKTGILVESNNKKQTIDALKTLYTDTNIYRQYSRNCINRVREYFDSRLLHSELISLYTKSLPKISAQHYFNSSLSRKN